MKRARKIVGLLCMIIVVLLSVASCNQSESKLPAEAETTTEDVTTPENTSSSENTVPPEEGTTPPEDDTPPEIHIHVVQILEAVEPTCTETGLSEGA